MTTSVDLGNGQSPIDIGGWVTSSGPAPAALYDSAASAVQRQPLPMIMFERGSEVRVGNDAYRLLQVHWHTPAEHTVEGVEFAAEVHLVHIGANDQLVVVGTMHELGAADEVIQRLIDETTRSEAEGTAPILNAAELGPPPDSFYRYVGSLTAPPFSEPVLWWLRRTIGTVSQRQVEELQALTGGPNARSLQDRNGRTVLCVGCGVQAATLSP